MTFKNEIKRELKSFTGKLGSLSILCKISEFSLSCSYGTKSITLDFSPGNLMVYHLFEQSEKLIAVIKSKLGLNEKIFARKCIIKRIENSIASDFLDKYHLMNSTSSAYNYGLAYEDKLLALATFSKGRKMNRLPADERSFELIRFCTLPGITVTGGLTKLIKHFCDEKKAGDVMTYVDKQFSEGSSFIKAGFYKHSEIKENYFLFHKTTHSLFQQKEKPEVYDHENFVLLVNRGNVKMIYEPVGQFI